MVENGGTAGRSWWKRAAIWAVAILTPVVVGGFFLWRASDLSPGEPKRFFDQARERWFTLHPGALNEPDRWVSLFEIKDELRAIEIGVSEELGLEFGVSYYVLADPARERRDLEMWRDDPEFFNERMRELESDLRAARLLAERAAEVSIEEQVADLVGATNLYWDRRKDRHPASIRSLARYLTAMARVHARAGASRDSIRAIDSVLWLGDRVFHSGPEVCSFLGVEFAYSGARAAWRVAQEEGFDGHEQLITMLQKHLSSDAAISSIEMERFGLLARLQMSFTEDGRYIVAEPDAGFPGRLDNLHAKSYPSSEEVFAAINDYFDQLLAVAHRPPGERLAKLRRLPSPRWPGMRLASIMKTTPTLVFNDAHREEHIVLTQTLVAIEWYRRVEGDLPAALEDLVPDYLPSLPRSPFSESGGIGYDRDPSVEGGFWLWGVGVDGEDNGGYTESVFQGLWPGMDHVLWPEDYELYPPRGDVPYEGDERPLSREVEDWSIFHGGG